MTGGLLQLVGKGSQDFLITGGNPSFTNFRTMYRKHTEFAMEHFRIYFKTSTHSYPTSGSLTLRTKIERYADLIHDCYLNFTLPAIYSPVVPITPGSVEHQNPLSEAVGYEFKWIQNIGYNMIRRVSVLINGQEIATHTGEWMKLYAQLNFDANKLAKLNKLIGNVPELYDPANAYDRLNQYPHAINVDSSIAAPSIPAYNLVIPLHFWFCENVGMSLPLIAIQNSEVELVVELHNAYELFTVTDVRTTTVSETSGQRIPPDTADSLFALNNFLSPPATIDSLRTWNFKPFVEVNYIFLGDSERSHIAKQEDQSFLITQIDMKQAMGHYGASNDLELGMRNLCTRVVLVSQRSDISRKNDPDNYTNWASSIPPTNSAAFSSGVALPLSVSQKDIVLESVLLLDGKERFELKQTEYFSRLQNYKYQNGNMIDGVYTYSFALNHTAFQPSGHMNGSMFNKTILRNSYIEPPLTTAPDTITTTCVLKSTANSPNPVIIRDPAAVDGNGKLIYSPSDIVTIIRKSDAQTRQYNFNVRAYIESYNFLRILGGTAGLMFSS